MKRYVQRGVWIGLGVLLGAITASADDSSVPIHGFADIIAGSSSSNTSGDYQEMQADQRLRGFGMGNIDFYLNPDLGGNIKSLFEIAIEPGGSTGGLAIDVERTQLGYAFTDNATLWVGRFHTPYGVWNTAFHHGGQLMTSVYRPRFIDFEDKGGLLPAHSVGTWLHGTAPVGSHKVIYDVFSANGPRIVTDSATVGDGTLDFNLIKSDRQGAMTGLNLAFQVGDGPLENLKIGVHGFTAPVNSYTGGSNYSSATRDNSTDVQMMGGYLFFDGDRIEIDAEYFRFNDKDTTSTASRTDELVSSLYFVELGVPVGKWKPYVLHEMVILNTGDNYFTNQKNAMSYTRNSLGFKYDLEATAALKFEYLMTNETWPSKCSYNTWVAQYAVRF